MAFFHGVYTKKKLKINMKVEIATKLLPPTKLQKVQNRAARILTFFSYDARSCQCRRSFKDTWLKKTLDMFSGKLKQLLMVYKSLNGLATE